MRVPQLGSLSTLISLLVTSNVIAVAIDTSMTALHARGIPGFPELIHYASAILGWQVVGLAKDTQQLGTFCSDFDHYSNRYAAVGLSTNYIKFPICALAGRSTLPKPEEVRAQIISYNTDIFITQLLNAFDTTTTSTVQGELSPLAYLCQFGLSYHRLEHFSLTSSRVMTAVCEAGGVALRTSDFSPAEHDAIAVSDFIRHISALFAAELAIGAGTSEDLTALNKVASDYVPVMDAMGLNGDVVRRYLAYIWMPLTPGEALTKVVEDSTEAFIVEILHVDHNLAGWSQWLCQHLDPDRMRRVGLNGDTVMKYVCSS